ncbi:MAG: hydrolase [Gammaproteobacteria bacterium]
MLEHAKSCLLVVDIQEKLIKSIHDYQRMLAHCEWLVELAQLLEVPIFVSEQYPKGLGTTVSVLKELLSKSTMIPKTAFSCVGDAECQKAIHALDKPQCVVIGIEAHVCILQTVFDLLNAEKDVFVVEDAISARNVSDKMLAIERMRQMGAQIVSREMVFFEWLRDAKHPKFKELSKQFFV